MKNTNWIKVLEPTLGEFEDALLPDGSTLRVGASISGGDAPYDWSHIGPFGHFISSGSADSLADAKADAIAGRSNPKYDEFGYLARGAE